MVGCPAYGISLSGTNILTLKSAFEPLLGLTTNVVSERFISFARSCIWSLVSPSASGNTASGLPQNGRSENTSTLTYLAFLMTIRDSNPIPALNAGAQSLGLTRTSMTSCIFLLTVSGFGMASHLMKSLRPWELWVANCMVP